MGTLVAAAAALAPIGLGSAGSTQALSCPTALGAACGPVDLVVGTVCGSGLPTLPSAPGITIEPDGGPVVNCGQLPV
jgi:hypothetical protein